VSPKAEVIDSDEEVVHKAPPAATSSVHKPENGGTKDSQISEPEPNGDAQSGEGDDGEEEEYEIEKIIKAERGRFESGRMAYFVKWKGYSSQHNSWVDEKDAVNAEELITEYWNRQTKSPRKEATSKATKSTTRTGRLSTSNRDGSPAARSESLNAEPKRGRTSRGKKDVDDEDKRPAKRARRESQVDDDPDPFLAADAADRLAKWKNIKSWEGIVTEIQTVEQADDHLRVYFVIKDGDEGEVRVIEDSKICAQKFPQKLIQFYESHLRWRDSAD